MDRAEIERDDIFLFFSFVVSIQQGSLLLCAKDHGRKLKGKIRN
jgi:hypothetical protein